MACGVPVVAAASGELPNVVGEAGRLFPEGDAAALAAELRAMYQQPAQAAALAAAGRERVLARYTQRAVAAATVTLYRQLAPAGNRL